MTTHGGGEGRAPIGRKTPVTPWGKPALGYKTRKNKKASNKLIVSRKKKMEVNYGKKFKKRSLCFDRLLKKVQELNKR